MSRARQKLGAEGERAAEKFLRRHRYAILERNYRCAVGEIDIVALHKRTVVFIEVKTRTHEAFGSPFEAIHQRKRAQMARVAKYYLTQNNLHDRRARFDVVGVWWEGGRVTCELVQNAFAIGE